jgi:hypothetical protein
MHADTAHSPTATNPSHFQGTEDEAAAAVDSWNLHRRHLTREQKREVIAFKLRENPGRSNRDIAAEVKVSKTTVAAVRNEAAVSGGQVDHLTDATASCDPPAPKPSVPASATPPPPPPPPVPPKVTGRDGKQYAATRPQPKPARSGQRRGALRVWGGTYVPSFL